MLFSFYNNVVSLVFFYINSSFKVITGNPISGYCCSKSGRKCFLFFLLTLKRTSILKSMATFMIKNIVIYK